MRSFGICVFIFAFTFPGCRDIGPSGSSRSIDGYRIEGTIFDGLEQPIDSLDIVLFYDAVLVSNTPVPVREYTVTTPGESVMVNVYDSEDQVVRNLYADIPAGSTLYVPWNKRRNNGKPAESGLYTVRYESGGQTRHSYEMAVHGHVTAMTDVNGFFAIGDNHLPIDYYPAPFYDDNDAFLGNFHILNAVYMEFTVANTVYSLSRVLEKGVIERVSVRLD